MSTAYFVVLNCDNPSFDPFVDGKLLTKKLTEINKIAQQLGLKNFEDFAFQDLSEYGGPEMEVEWFDASEGTKWASTILRHLNEVPGSFPDVEAVKQDLKDYIRVFNDAGKSGLKWHLELDF